MSHSYDLSRGAAKSVLVLSSAAAALLALAAPGSAHPAPRPGTAAAKHAEIERLVAGSGRSSQPSTQPAIAVRSAVRSHHATRAAQAPDTTPSDFVVDGTSGLLTLTAQSNAMYVWFKFAGSPVGDPVQVTDNVASTTVASWGYANGTHGAAALDCSSAATSDCDAVAPASASADLDNVAPTVTAPRDGDVIAGGFTIKAQSSGGGVEFLIDGTRRGFDGSAPYSFAYTGSALSEGRHVIKATQCSADGTRCSGPVSDSVVIHSDSLHPKITSLAPARFSPNGDHVKDATTVTYSLPDTEHVSVTVTDSHGRVVRGSHSLGTLHEGRHSWTWNGRSDDKKVVSSGGYKITLNTSASRHSVLVRGSVWRHVTVDDRAPSIGSLSAGSAVYPVRDGYRDTVPVRFRLGERAAVKFVIRDSAGRKVRTVASHRSAGHVTLTWSGRDASGHIAPAGRYGWTLSARDEVGNVSHVRSGHVVVSAKRLVAHSTTITRDGDSFYTAGGSNSGCTTADAGLSSYAHGVWLLNTCFGEDEAEVAAAFYRVRVPAATVYSRMSVSVGGFAQYVPSSLTIGFGVHGRSNDFGLGGFYEINSSDAGWYHVGSIKAANYVSSNHTANIAVSVTNLDAPCDFDLSAVRIHLTYQVLQ
jgi:flagellar hook assembly protein FlgD